MVRTADPTKMIQGDLQIDTCLYRDENGKAFSLFIVTHMPTGIQRRYESRGLSGKEKHKKYIHVLREIEDEIIEKKLYEYILPDPLSYRWKRFG